MNDQTSTAINEFGFGLGYTVSDDGVHVRCPACSWSECLGFSATIGDAIRAATEHLAARAGRGKHALPAFGNGRSTPVKVTIILCEHLRQVVQIDGEWRHVGRPLVGSPCETNQTFVATIEDGWTLTVKPYGAHDDGRSEP